MTLQDTIKGLKEIEYAWEMAESEQDICLKDTYLRSIYSATKYLENEDALISCVSGRLKNSVSIDRVLEIIDSSIEDVEALPTGREGAVSEERKVGMLLEAKAIRTCVENLKGGDKE